MRGLVQELDIELAAPAYFLACQVFNRKYDRAKQELPGLIKHASNAVGLNGKGGKDLLELAANNLEEGGQHELALAALIVLGDRIIYRAYIDNELDVKSYAKLIASKQNATFSQLLTAADNT